jgi:hypothetical protein
VFAKADGSMTGTAVGKRRKVTPLEYMLNVVNDETADVARRDRLAVAAAPFVHRRADEVGQREKMRRDAATSHLDFPEWSELIEQ